MAKIPAEALVKDFQRMLDERWPYVAGGSGKDGVDCSGAFVWAYRQHGKSIYHGSNRIAREEVEALYPIGSVKLVPGMAAFKCRGPGEPYYALPSGYQAGGSHDNGDLGDYYHIGLVDEDTARVLNAQSASTGFVASDIGKGWTHVGYLKQVDYGMSASAAVTVTSSDTAVTVAPSGSTVNLRKSASKSAALVERIPLGQTVTLRGPELGGWYPVRWGKKEGWVMAEFLRADGGQAKVPETGYSSYALCVYDLSYEQAARLQQELGAYRTRLEGLGG